MAGCVLRAFGAAFDAEGFLPGASLEPASVWRRGKLDRRGRAAAHGGFNVVVSEADELRDQVRDALAFLAEHRPALLRLVAAAGVEGVTLDFGVVRRDVAAQCDEFPPALVRAAGELGMGLGLSQYAGRGGG